MSDQASTAAAAGASSPAAASGASPHAGGDKTKSLKTKRSPLNVAAVHVVKAALLATLGPQCGVTQSAEYVHATKAELTVSYEADDTLTPDQFAAIERKANELIEANTPLVDVPLLPSGDLVVCPGPCAARTGELRVLKMLKMRKRKAQKGYEFSFVVHAAAEDLQEKNAQAVAATNSKKTQAVQQAAVAGADKSKKPNTATAAAGAAAASSSSSSAQASVQANYVVETTQAIFHELVLPAFAKMQMASAGSVAPPLAATSAAASALTPAELASLKVHLLPQLETYLVMLANQAYTRGFTAKEKSTQTIDLARLL